MNAYSYDFHTHSCLSPCGDDDMTPNNMVNMALLAGCEIMAITDHNTCKNAPAVMKAGEKAGLLVIPGMELCVQEEAHIVCLFETLEGAMDFDSFIYSNMPHIKNKPEVFGYQRFMDENDTETGIEENLLIISAFTGVNEVAALAENYGGAAFPAHVDRNSFSVIASLGAIPDEAGFTCAELTYGCNYEKMAQKYPGIADKFILRSSDAHYLEVLAGEKCRIKLPEKSAAAVIDFIKNGVKNQ